MSHHKDDHHHELAGFSDRVVAFAVDMSLFVGGYFLSLSLLFPQYSVFRNPNEGVFAAAWTGLFLLFQAFMTSEGRRSPGKALVGIRVVDLHGDSLSVGQAFVRSLAYLPSSVLNLGFAWVLANPARQGWHDLAVGSLVIESRRRSALTRATLRAASGGVLALIGSLWYWNNLAKPRYEAIMDVAYAKVGLEEISKLQRIYKIQNGRYTDDLGKLAPLTGEPKVFLDDMGRLFDAKAGIKIELKDKGYRVVARATDSRRTLVSLDGPPPRA